VRLLAVVPPLAIATLARAADPALMRTHLEAPDPLWVGERVTMVVELLTATTFASAATFDLPSVPGALLMEPQDRPVVGTEAVDGASYTTQRHELAFFPMRAGAFEVPAFTVRFGSPAEPGGRPVERRLTTSPVRVEARMPPGASGVAGLVSTRELTVTEDWRPRPGDRARVGDAFTRTVTRTAAEVPGLAFPPLPSPRVVGVATYPSPPVVQDRVERGEFTGRRVDEVTYVLERAGTVTFPEVCLTWWNVASRQLETVTLPAVTVQVGAAPAARGAWVWWAGIAIVLAAAALAAWRRREALHAAWRRWRARRAARDVLPALNPR
jgi:hypothetical protein